MYFGGVSALALANLVVWAVGRVRPIVQYSSVVSDCIGHWLCQPSLVLVVYRSVARCAVSAETHRIARQPRDGGPVNFGKQDARELSWAVHEFRLIQRCQLNVYQAALPAYESDITAEDTDVVLSELCFASRLQPSRNHDAVLSRTSAIIGSGTVADEGRGDIA